MKNIESIGNNSIESERDPVLEKLWRKYRFANKPPIKESVAEQRLFSACKKYISLVDNMPTLISAGIQPDSENYFANRKSVDFVKQSDSARRELHNQIAIMVVGKPRSGMEESLALKIADFAREYVDKKISQQ